MADYTLSARLTADAKGFVSGIKQAQNEMNGLQKFSQKIGQKMQNFGSSLSNIGSNLTNKITKPAAAAGVAVAGITFAKGFQRLTSIDTAQAKLKALGHDTKSVDAIMDSALTSVKGTSFGLGEAATVAASAVAAGVQPGKELTEYLTLAGDAAAIAGVDMNEMGSIFNKVQTSNKAYNGDLQQLVERGLPVYQWLAEEAGVTEDAVFDMASAGQISSEMFREAIEKNIGGAAGIMGAESFTAALANVGAAIGRIGAAFLDAGGKGGGFFSTLKPLMASFIEKLDGMGDVAEKAGVKFGEMFIGLIDKIKEVKGWYDGLSPPMQNIINKTMLWGSIGAVAIGPILKILGPVIQAFGFLASSVLPKVVSGFKMLGPVIAFLTTPTGLIIALIGSLVAAFIYAYNTSETFREKVQFVFEAVKEVVMNVIGVIKEFIMEVWGGIVEWWQENNERILEAAQNIWNMISIAIEFAMDIIVGIFQLVWPFIEMLIIDTWEAIKNTIQGAIDVILGIVSFFASLFTGDWQGLWDATKQILSGAVQLLWGLVNLWFVGKILKVGKSFIKLFSNVFKTGWSFIKNVFTNSVNAVKNFVTTGFNAIKSKITTIMNGIRGFISTVWNAIKSVISKVVNGVKNVVSTGFNAVKSKTSSIFNSVKSVASKVWNGIKTTISTVVNAIRSTVSSVFNSVKSKVSSIFNSIKSTASSVWNGIKSTISSVVNGIKSTVSRVFNNVKSTVSRVFGNIKSTATRIWNGVKDAITKPIETAKKTVSGIIDDIKGFFTNLKLKIPSPKLPSMPSFSLKTSSKTIMGKEIKFPTGFKVNWNAQGGVFSRPTIFNTGNAGMQGVGEAGPEAILPLNSKVLGGIGKGIVKSTGDMGGTTINNENNVTVHAVIKNEGDIDKLAYKLDEKLSDLGSRRRAAFGG